MDPHLRSQTDAKAALKPILMKFFFVGLLYLEAR